MEILNTKIERGQSYELSLNIAKLHASTAFIVPVIIERSTEDGPVILLNAAVHGDELNGVGIVRRVIEAKLNKPLKGTIICIPVLNIFGFINLSRKFPDGRDLNRSFPGSKDGSIASQFAYEFLTEIAPYIEYMIDFHAGGADRDNDPQIRCDGKDEKALELAKVFGTDFILHSKLIANSLRNSLTEIGKTVLLFEGGKSLNFDENIINHGVKGAIRILNHLGMQDEKIDPPIQSLVIEKSKWIRAAFSGLLHLEVINGSKVKKKDILGYISDPYGSFKKKITASSDGYIICVNTTPVVNKGDAVFHISNEAED
jgi:predicted deacylase